MITQDRCKADATIFLRVTASEGGIPWLGPLSGEAVHIDGTVLATASGTPTLCDLRAALSMQLLTLPNPPTDKDVVWLAWHYDARLSGARGRAALVGIHAETRARHQTAQNRAGREAWLKTMRAKGLLP